MRLDPLDLVFLGGLAGWAVGRRRHWPAQVSGGLAGGVAAYLMGTGLNLVTALANGGRFPIIGASSAGYAHITAGTRLALLGDRIYILGGSIASIGDLLVWAGEFAIAIALLSFAVQTLLALARRHAPRLGRARGLGGADPALAAGRQLGRRLALDVELVATLQNAQPRRPAEDVVDRMPVPYFSFHLNLTAGIQIRRRT